MPGALLESVGDVGGYRVSGRLHEGGDGVTYLATELGTGRAVVIKAPRRCHSRAHEAFLDEIATLQLLNRAGVPGVVQLLGSGFCGGTPWYAMNWIEGPDLAAHIRGLWEDVCASPRRRASAREQVLQTQTLELGSVDSQVGALAENAPVAPTALAAPSDAGTTRVLDARERGTALRLLGELAACLAAVHAQGVLHGDLSPGNIMLGAGGSPILLDFGTALTVFEPGRPRELAAVARQRRATPRYAAPELLLGQLIDARVDIYSLGCIAYELLTGKPPFTANDRDALVRQHLRRAPDFSAAAGALPGELIQLLRRMLEKEPSRRLPHALEAAEEFSRWARDPRPRSVGSQALGVFRPRLAGRAELLGRIRRVINAGHGGRGGMILIHGRSGQGKTRLLNEVGFDAERIGSEVIVCRCGQGPAPSSSAASSFSSGLELFGPVFERLGAAVTNGLLAIGGEADDPLREALAAVQPYSPVRFLPDAASERPALSPAAAKQRVNRSFSFLLGRLAALEPLVLLLDDLQWADELSASFLCESAPEFAKQPIVVIGATRDRIRGADVERLRTSARLDETLSSLSPEEVTSIAKDLLGADVLPDGFLEFLVRHCEGAPLFIAESTRAALREGWLRREAAGRWSFTAPRQTLHTSMAATVADMLVERTRHLSRPALDALKFAVVLGRDFDGSDLLELGGDRAVSRSALNELVAHEILLHAPPDQYRFTHDAIRDAHERAMTPDDRQRLHGLAAEIVTRKPFTRGVQRAARLGHHWAMAGEPRRSLEYFKEAAAAAVREHSLSLAIDLYRSAQRQCESVEGCSPGELAALTESVGDVLITLAWHGEARTEYRKALALQTEPGALAHARLLRKLATSCWTLHEYEEAARTLAEAERALGSREGLDEDGYRELIQIKIGRAQQLYFSQARGDELGSLLAELRDLVDARGTEAQKSTYYVGASSYLMMHHRYAFDDEMLRLAELAISASSALSLEDRAQARFTYAFALTLGTVDMCRQALLQFGLAAKDAEVALHATLSARIAVYRAIATLRTGDVDGTVAAAAIARTAAEAAQQTPYIAAVQACIGWAGWRRGDPGARRVLDEARALWLSHTHPFPMRWLATFPLAAFALAEDDFERCKMYLDDQLNPGQQALPHELRRAIERAAVACQRSPPRAAALEVDAALRLARQLGYC